MWKTPYVSISSVHWHWHSVSTLTVLTQYGYGPYSNIIFHGHYHSKRHSLKHGIVIFYTEILTGKVVLWCFFTSEKSAKIHNSTFLVKISEFVKISFSFERSYHVYMRGCCSKIWPCCNLSQCTILAFFVVICVWHYYTTILLFFCNLC